MSTLKKIKDGIISFVKKEVVLSIAFVAMVITCFFIPPDKLYLDYFEYKTLIALFCMLAVVILIIAGFTYYTSVAQDQPFRRRFGEMALISIGVAVVSFVVGILAKKFLGVDL